MKYCPHCGQLIKSDSLICPYCGYQQSRVSRDEQSNRDYDDRINSGQNNDQYEQRPVRYSKAKLTGLDWATLIINVLDAGTLLFLGFQGLTRPFYINNVGTFITVILSLAGIITVGFQMRENHVNRLPNWASFVALVGDVSVFALILMFNQQVLLVSVALLVLALLIFDRELHKIY